jgi:sugar lactone lactonase YvrE
MAGAAHPAFGQTASLLYAQSDVANGVNYPQGVAVDASGNVYIADEGNNRVVKATLTSGTYSAPSTVVSGLIYADGVAVDSSGNLYIADHGQSGILKETLSAGVYTQSLIGNGFNPFSVAVDSSGNLYAADGSTGNLYIETLQSGIYTQSSVALTSASGVAVDSSGNIYVAQPPNHQVLKGTVVSGVYMSFPVATGLNSPIGVAVDAGGNVYIADNGADQVYKEAYAPSTGTYTQSVLATGLSAPVGVAVDSSGAVYVSDAYGGGRVLKLQPASPDFGSQSVGSSSASLTVTFAVQSSGTFGTPLVLTQGAQGLDFALGTGSTCTGSLSAGSTCTVNITFTPHYPGLRMGAVELTNASGGVVATALVQGVGSGPQIGFTPGTISTFAGNGTACSVATAACGDGSAATAANLFNPHDVALDGAGNVYIADANDNRIRKVSASGTISTIAGTGATGYNPSQDGGPAISATLYTPSGLALDGAGNLYIADTYNHLIREVVAATGDIVRVAGTGTLGSNGDGGTALSATLHYPYGVAVDGAGNLYVADTYNDVVRKITAATGTITRVAGNYSQGFSGDGGVATSAELFLPYSAALDVAGNLLIADTNNNRVREVSASTGFINTVAGNGTSAYSGDGVAATGAELSSPTRVRADAAGDLYIADYNNDRIRKVTEATGFISTIAGTGTASSTGDGGPATSATINGPFTVTPDSAGNLYIAESTDNRIRAITASAAALTFASTAVGSTSSDSPQTVIVSNFGNTDLTFPPPATAGAENPAISANFIYGSSSTCTQVGFSASSYLLPGGASCSELISFMPQMAGTITGSLVDTDDTLNVAGATQSVALNGTATSATPVLSVASTSSVYGATATLSAAISYSGAAPTGSVTFTIGGNPSSAELASCSAASGFRTCMATYTNLSLVPGPYSIHVTEVADSSYNATSGTGTLTVTQATPTVTVTSQSIPYGTATTTLSAQVAFTGASAPMGGVNIQVGAAAAVPATCSGSSSPLLCRASYNTSALSAGVQSITATEVGDIDYNPTSGTGTLTVTQLTQTVTVPSQSVPYGTATATITARVAYTGSTAPTGALSITVDSGTNVAALCAGASSPLTCTASYATAALGTGVHTITASQAASTDYTSASASGTLTVTKIAPGLVVNSSPPIVYRAASATLSATITYTGAAAPTGTLTFALAGGATVAATCTGSSSPLTCLATYPASALNAGSQSIVALLAGDANYTAASATGTLTVSQAAPTITWATPASIPLGTPLSATQLNATANVAGSFAYTPAAGTILPAGPQTLAVIFTPSNATDYTIASQTVQLVVVPFAAQPIITPGSGGYAAAQTVTIADSTPGAAIHYTTDGSTPTAASAHYNAPLTIAATETIEAIATATGYETSAVSVATITIYKPPVCTLSVQGTSTALNVIALASCSDPQGQALTSTLNWGDGTSIAAAARNVHTYASGGTYTVVLSATDTSGLTGTAQQQVTPNQLPVCSLGLAQAAASNYAASVTVACTDPQNRPLALTIDWGDDTGTVTATNNAVNMHTYPGPNTPSTTPYTITLTAVDTSGLAGSAVQPVTILPIAAPVAAGGSSSVPVSIQAPMGTQITAICTSVSSTINGQVVTDALPSQYGISCSAPIVTLSASTTQVNVTITTSSATRTAAYDPGNSTGVFYSIVLPFPALASFILGLISPARSRRRRHRGVAPGMILILCLALSSCGGSFTPPPVVATPAGQYYITIVQVSVTSPPPSGFVQTSLIVPLPISNGGS